MKKIEAQEGWGGKGLKFKVAGEGGAGWPGQPSPSSSGYQGEAGAGWFSLLGRGSIGEPGESPRPYRPGLRGGRPDAKDFSTPELATVLKEVAIDSPILSSLQGRHLAQDGDVSATLHRKLGHMARWSRPESVAQSDRREARSLSFSADPSPHQDPSAQRSVFFEGLLIE